VARATILSDRGVQLSLATLTGLFVVAMLAQIRQDSGLLTLLLETLERALKVFIVVDDDFGQTDSPPFAAFAAPDKCIEPFNLSAGRRGCQRAAGLTGRPVHVPTADQV
jgi:hypothetical protein